MSALNQTNPKLPNVPLNLFYADSFRVKFSNIPTVGDPSMLGAFENFVRGIQIPEYGMAFDQMEFEGAIINQPITPHSNLDLGDLVIEFKLIERFYNYHRLFVWLQNLRTGHNIHTKSGHLKDYVTNLITIELLNNSKNRVAMFQFSRCIISGLSPVNLQMGTSDELTFSASFKIEQMNLVDDPNFYNGQT